MISRAGLRLAPLLDTRGRIPAPIRALALCRLRSLSRHAIAVIVAKRTRRVLGQGVAVSLAVGGAHEGGDDLEVPLRYLACLAPEVGEAEIDVELEEVDPGGLL